MVPKLLYGTIVVVIPGESRMIWLFCMTIAVASTEETQGHDWSNLVPVGLELRVQTEYDTMDIVRYISDHVINVQNVLGLENSQSRWKVYFKFCRSVFKIEKALRIVFASCNYW